MIGLPSVFGPIRDLRIPSSTNVHAVTFMWCPVGEHVAHSLNHCPEHRTPHEFYSVGNIVSVPATEWGGPRV